MMWGEDMYYFLDVDGVLNRESDWCKPFTVNPICVRNFKKLLSNDKDSHVILSSTWRQGFTNAGIKSSRADSLMNVFDELGIHIEGTTPISNKSRQEEIEYYIKRNGIKDYLVLDDDESLFPRLEDINLFITNYKEGLTEADVRQIVRRKKRG